MNNTSQTPLNLSKGEILNLRKEGQTLDRISIALGWDISDNTESDHSFDLDASVLLLTDGKLGSNNNIVFFGRKELPGVHHQGDNLTGAGDGDDETINLELNNLHADINECVFVVNIYEALQRNQRFSDVSNAFIRAYNTDTKEEICRYELSGNTHTTNALVLGSIRKIGDNWHFEAREEAMDGDLNTIAARFN